MTERDDAAAERRVIFFGDDLDLGLDRVADEHGQLQPHLIDANERAAGWL